MAQSEAQAEIIRLGELYDKAAQSVVKSFKIRIQSRIEYATDPVRKEAFQDIMNEEIRDMERMF